MASESNTRAQSREELRVGLVGIGNMGGPMCANMIKAGWKVTVYDIAPERVDRVVQSLGARAASSLSELGRNSDVVITMLPDGHVVRRVVLGASADDDCLARGMGEDTVVIDMSSSAPVGTRKLGEDLRARGISLIDAPVSGGVKGAVAGTLAIMIGGDKAVADGFDDLLASMGKRFYVGSLGSGHAAKVLNNYVSAAGLAAAAEAVVVAQRFGIEPQTLIDVINASTGRNNSTENKFAQFILNGRFNSGFALGLMAKDIALAVEVAEAVNVRAALGHACLDLWKKAEDELGGAADHTEIAKYVSGER
ncbi:MAG: NAD(P)-dependent oxidoreductase [Burkholderiales bacterium]